ncbi:MAG: PcfK-like family protein [Prevotella sp.]|nr:PcfK-like family protein [Prevotella sp.]
MKATDRFKETIKAYLDRKAETDEYFALSYEQPNKSLEECIDYILTTVQKSGAAGFADEEIYGMAVHYYQEDNPGEIKTHHGGTVVVNHAVELTEEEKAQAKQKAIDEIVAKEKQKIAEQEKKAREAAKAKAEEAKKRNEAEGLLSLFGED